MQNLNWEYIIDAVVSIYGLYVFASSLKMKKTGEISSFVASPGELFKCKDKKGFADAISGKMMAFGLLTFFFGVLNFVNEMYWKKAIITILIMGIFLLICAVFISFLRKNREKYLNLK